MCARICVAHIDVLESGNTGPASAGFLGSRHITLGLEQLELIFEGIQSHPLGQIIYHHYMLHR